MKNGTATVNCFASTILDHISLSRHIGGGTDGYYYDDDDDNNNNNVF
jgi:hypothetical protein